MPQRTQGFFGIITPFLKGIGQIMLQNSAWTGLFFLAGIFTGSYLMGVAAIVAVVTGTVTAILLGYDKDEIHNGIYGFSAALVGVALICFFQPTVIIWIVVVLGSSLATIIQHFFSVKKIPVFTMPFILVTWLFLSIFHYLPVLAQPMPVSTSTASNDYLSLFSHGFGQVIFQSNIWAGALFIIGIFIHRPITAIYALAGIALSAMTAYLLKEPVNDIYLGLLSYNAVLCIIVFASNKTENLIMAFVAIVLSVLIVALMRYLSLPVLTFPFVLATWLTLVIKMAKKQRR